MNGEERKRVIGYVSKAFNTAERRYSAIEREVVAIRFFMIAFRAFLYSEKFVICTDHEPLVYLKRMKVVDSQTARTIENLSI